MSAEVKPAVSPTQLRFARVLEIGMFAGLVLLAAGFVIYVAGWLPSMITLDSLPQFWGMSAAEYRSATAAMGGTGRLPAGETLPLIGFDVLCATAPVACLALLPVYFRQRDWIYLVIAGLEIVVIASAASGVLSPH